MAEVVTIVDYNAGNLTSVRLAVQKLGRVAAVTARPEEVRASGRVIFPGVGAAGAAMTTLRSRGLSEALMDYAGSGRPLLGICLGAQIILEQSEEDLAVCLGLIRGNVERLRVPSDAKVPHMGWNQVTQARTHHLWKGVEQGSYFYFVHSYAPRPASRRTALGYTDYHGRFASALAEGNVAATQFHPERSGEVGLRVLENFLTWRP